MPGCRSPRAQRCSSSPMSPRSGPERWFTDSRAWRRAIGMPRGERRWWWVGHVFDDWKLPLHVQDSLRGGNENPIIRIGEAASDLVHLDVDGLHFPFAVAFIVLAIIVWRRLPLSYGVYSVAVVVTSLAARNLNSIERYGLLNAFPLVIGLALAVPTRRAER